MTRNELGGQCHQKLSAHTWKEMVQVVTTQLMGSHPDVDTRMKEMHDAEIRPKWDRAPAS